MNTSNARAALGPRLRAARLARGVGLRELARLSDLSPSSIEELAALIERPAQHEAFVAKHGGLHPPPHPDDTEEEN
jgi:hypothetical protein